MASMPDPTTTAGKVTRPARQALCGECGNLRTARGAQRNYVSEGTSPENIAVLLEHSGGRRTKASERAHAYWSSVKPWQRVLEDLKCSACGTITRHAALRDGEHRDFAEETDRRAKPRLSVEDQLELLRSLGAHVREEMDDPRLIAGVGYYVGDASSFDVGFNPDAPTALLAKDLEEIIERVINPSGKTWYLHDGDDADGDVWAGIRWSR